MNSLLAVWACLALARLMYEVALAQRDAGTPYAALVLRRELARRSYTALIEACLHTLASAHRQALAAHAHGTRDDVALALATTRQGVGTLVPDLLARMQVWSEVLAELSTGAPVAPLRTRDLRLPRLRAAARGEACAAPWLTALLRLRLHVALLRFGLRVAWRGLQAERVPAAGPAWTSFDALGRDLVTLARDSVVTYDAVLHATQRHLDARAASLHRPTPLA